MSTEGIAGRQGPAARRAWLVSTHIKSLDTNGFVLHLISSDEEWMTVRVLPPSGNSREELDEKRLRAAFAASPYPSLLLVQYADNHASLMGAGFHAPPEPWRLSRPEQGVEFQLLRPPAEWIRWTAEMASSLPSVINLPKGVMAEGLELARWVLMEAGIMLLDEELRTFLPTASEARIPTRTRGAARNTCMAE